MGTTLIERGHAPSEPTGADDPFHDPVLGGIGIAFALVAIAILLLTGLIHWGVEYRTPPWEREQLSAAIVH